jgi:hypothetical protein
MSGIMPSLALPGQLLLVLTTLAAALSMPPARGAMLLIPLDGQIPAAALNVALDAEARILARGPVPGSLIVDARRARVVTPLFKAGILTVAAPARWCGA